MSNKGVVGEEERRTQTPRIITTPKGTRGGLRSPCYSRQESPVREKGGVDVGREDVRVPVGTVPVTEPPPFPPTVDDGLGCFPRTMEPPRTFEGGSPFGPPCRGFGTVKDH